MIGYTSIAKDIGPKRDLYESHKIPECFIQGILDSGVLLWGYRYDRDAQASVELRANENGRLWSEVLGLHLQIEGRVIRFYYTRQTGSDHRGAGEQRSL